MGTDDGEARAIRDPILNAVRSLQRRPARDKIVLLLLASLFVLFLLWWSVEDHDVLFILSEVAHIVGVSISLQSQLLTSIFLLARLLCSFLMEYDLHTVLDALTLAGTGTILFGFTFLRDVRITYQREADSVKFFYVLIPVVALSFACYPPSSGHWLFLRITWAFCVYLESVSVLPQLMMLRKSNVVERFTAHYVFALGVSRFLNCSHWLLKMIDGEDILGWAAET
eukprot:gene27702-7344_t